MLDSKQDADIIAAHEAGHVVVALHLGLTPLGVILVQEDTSPARTVFEDGALSSVPFADRNVLAFSGVAGQLNADKHWHIAHSQRDVAWLLSAGEEPEDHGLTRAREAITDHSETFDHVRGAIETGLADGVEFLALDDLLPDPGTEADPAPEPGAAL